jgi:hypothetical protein
MGRWDGTDGCRDANVLATTSRMICRCCLLLFCFITLRPVQIEWHSAGAAGKMIV